jgi:hypothetical protein
MKQYYDPQITTKTIKFKEHLSHKILFKIFGRERLKKFPIWFLIFFRLTYILWTVEKATLESSMDLSVEELYKGELEDLKNLNKEDN